MRTMTFMASVAFIVLGVLAPPDAALAQKKGGGGGTPVLCSESFTPSFINILTTTLDRTAVNQVRLANRSGGCQITLASGAIGDDVLLIKLGVDNLGVDLWRTVWTTSDGLSVIVNDYAVGTDSTATLRVGRTLPVSEPVLALEAIGAGNFLITTRVANSSLTPPKLWRAAISASASGSSVGFLGAIACSPIFSGDVAVGPDGDTLYVMSDTEIEGVRTYALRTFRLSDSSLASNLLACIGSEPPGGPLVLEGGNTNSFAVGQCGSGFTCIAIERTNVRGIPCTPDYYRTDVYNLDVRAALPVIVQLAYPAWGSNGELFGRQTGSSSKNACTAKVYTQAVRHAVALSGSIISVSAATFIGSAHAVDAPNPVAIPIN